MKRNLFLFCFCLLPLFSVAQEHRFCSLYFNNGKLQADSSLAISADQFKAWWRAEPNIVATIAANLTYPQVCLRNAVEGRTLVAFDFTGTEVKNIRILNISHDHFNEAAINAVQNSAKVIVEELTSRKHLGNLKGTYYLPLVFELIDVRKEIKKRGAVPIIQPSLPHFQNRNLEY